MHSKFLFFISYTLAYIHLFLSPQLDLRGTERKLKKRSGTTIYYEIQPLKNPLQQSLNISVKAFNTFVVFSVLLATCMNVEDSHQNCGVYVLACFFCISGRSLKQEQCT